MNFDDAISILKANYPSENYTMLREAIDFVCKELTENKRMFHLNALKYVQHVISLGKYSEEQKPGVDIIMMGLSNMIYFIEQEVSVNQKL
jgi:hypothetical protein